MLIGVEHNIRNAFSSLSATSPFDIRPGCGDRGMRVQLKRRIEHGQKWRGQDAGDGTRALRRGRAQGRQRAAGADRERDGVARA